MRSGIELIAAERERQLALGYDAKHDAQLESGELADAAAVYSDAAGAIVRGASPDELHIREDEDDDGPMYVGAYTGIDGSPSWPFDDHKLHLDADPLRNLAKAGALIAAEIDRLLALPGASLPLMPSAVDDTTQTKMF